LYGLDNFLTYLVWGANKTSVYGDVHTAAHAHVAQTVKRYYSLRAGLTYKRYLWPQDYAAVC
jgi:hypothetical protein